MAAIEIDFEEEIPDSTTICRFRNLLISRGLLEKGKRYHFGYKSFVTVDAKDGYVEKVATTPANVSESRYFEQAIDGVKTRRYYADKGYASAENREILRRKGIKSGIMHSAYRNKPLSHWQKVFNKLVSKVRYKVKRAFGTMKRKFKFVKASYFGTEKVHGQCVLKAIAFNLLKAVNIA